MDEYIVVLVTAKDELQAKMISKSLLDQKAAACCNVINSVSSLFSWKGKVCDESEVLLVIKTRLSLFEQLEGIVKREHSYEVPEIIALPIIKGSKEYLNWINEETQKNDN